MITSEGVYYPDFNLGDFRYAFALVAKLLIRARWKLDPGFLTEAELIAWDVPDIARDPWPAWKLLDQAATALGRLNRQFLPLCGSGGVRATDESTPAGRLILLTASLIPDDCGGPEHNGTLREAARLLRDGKDVDWCSLASWGSLEAIRADLELLPHPRREIAPTDPFLGLVETLGRLADSLSRDSPARASQPPPPEALSKEDAATFLGIGVSTVEHLIRTRKVRYVQLGSQRGRVIPVEALRKLLQDNIQLTGEEEGRRRRGCR